MKIYSYTSDLNDNKQLLAKNIKELDGEINSIVQFIDTFNANYNILNRKENYDGTTVAYYSDAMLQDTDGLNIVNQQYGTYVINIFKMHLHQIIENTFGKNIYFRLKDNETEETTKSHIIEQGYAICHDGFKSDGSISYSVLPLSPSGGYYIVANKILENIDATHKNLKMTMSYDERAVDKFGLSPIISFCPPGTRVFYNNYIGLRQIEPTESDQILTYNYLNDFMDQSGWRLCTAKTGPDMTAKGLWDTTLMLGHEVVLFDNNTSEEVIIDETVETSLIRVGETAKSLYTINTNLTENDLLNSTDKKLFINFY